MRQKQQSKKAIEQQISSAPGAIPLIYCLTALLLYCSVSARAQDEPPADAKPLPEFILSDLNAESFAAREAATLKLLADDSIDPQAVADLYPKATTAEQRNRLIDVARHHFIRKLRLQLFPGARLGALGVIQAAMSADQLPKIGKPAARVVATLPGFPAYVALRAGDLVVAVNDEGLPPNLSPEETSAHFGRMIIDHRQDSVINLTVWRDGKTIEVKVRLASSDAIRNMFEPTNQRLLPQYRVRWLRFFDAMVDAGHQPTPLPVDLTPAE
jgi:hypothetical protein